MSIIDSSLRTAFEKTIMRSPRCIISPTRMLSTRSITIKDDVIQVLKDVYFHPTTLWAHARGGKGKNTLTNNGDHRSSVECVLAQIGERIYQYFNIEPNVLNNQANFDVFHESLCDSFLQDINEIRARVDYAPMSYGQAQKLINLSFKYISCFSDYLDFADFFTHCHIVIDNVVLKNLASPMLSKMFSKTITEKIQGLSGGRFNEHGWTDFSKEDYIALMDEYRRVISPHLENLTYIELEYNMWPTIGPVSTTRPMQKSVSKFYI